jgi:hypothetical protein
MDDLGALEAYRTSRIPVRDGRKLTPTAYLESFHDYSQRF